MEGDPGPRSLSHRAADDLTFIRSTMQRSSVFTAVPGFGGVVTGVIGLAAAVVGERQPTPNAWLATWLAAAVGAVAVDLVAMAVKARRAGVSLAGANARRFAVAGAAPLVAGAAITYGLWATGTDTLLAPVWLLLYGAGLLAGGQFTIRPVRAMGVCFMGTGIGAMLTPPAWGDAWLALGFGGLHLGFGAYIARYHGG